MIKVMTGVNLALVLALGIGMLSVKTTLTDRIAAVESTAQQEQSDNEKYQHTQLQNEKKLAEVLADLEVIKQRAGSASTELDHARKIAQSLKRQQEQAEKQLAAKANSSDIDALRQESTNKLNELQQDSNTKLGSVSGDVAGLRKDLVAAQEDFGRQLVDVKTTLSAGIAKNSSELAELRKKGERDYFEFDISKSSKQSIYRIADIQLLLLKTDVKKHKYNVAIQVDDNRLEKKDRNVNEPVQFLVGRDQLRYEVVVNAVDKDRIRGYVSAPKDKVLGGEGPKFRLQ
jgi:hypothetical protein